MVIIIPMYAIKSAENRLIIRQIITEKCLFGDSINKLAKMPSIGQQKINSKITRLVTFFLSLSVDC